MIYRPLSQRLTYSQGATAHPRHRKDSVDGMRDEARKNVIRHISEGTYQLIERSCPICSSQEIDVVADVERFGLNLPFSLCRKCGFFHANPALREEDYHHFYANYFRRMYNARIGMPSLDMLQRKKKSNQAQIRRLEKKAPVLQERSRGNTTRVLDVGCGAGNFTWAWQEHGYQAVGIDLNEEYLKLGCAQGLDLRVATTKELVTQGDQFDVVSYHHVFEHILDPIAELSNAKALLSEGGLLCIVVPGVKNIPRKYFCDLRDYLHIAHPSCFTRETLRSAAGRVGFVEVHADDHIYAIFEKRGAETTECLSSDWRHYEEVTGYIRALEDRYYSEEGLYRIVSEHKSRMRKSKSR